MVYVEKYKFGLVGRRQVGKLVQTGRWQNCVARNIGTQTVYVSRHHASTLHNLFFMNYDKLAYI